MLQVVCLKAGSAYGVEYVNILFDMVRRSLPEGFEGKFTCFTDDPTGIDSGILSRSLPAQLPGWWGKLALFKKGLFSPGDRILFFDLDTLITGRLDKLCEYKGPFALLRDFFRPDGLQSAVMAWEADTCTDIWESYSQWGCPLDYPGGDQAWIEKLYLQSAKRLQDIFPKMFISYKQSSGTPSDASVVCFHGIPKPHEVLRGWVPAVWKIGGLTRSEMIEVCNTEKEVILSQVRYSSALFNHWFDFQIGPSARGAVCIVGSSPSLADNLDILRYHKEQGHPIWATNAAFSYLMRHGIVPDAHILLDARPENAQFVQPTKGVKYYIASQCHPDLVHRLQEMDVTLYHCQTAGMIELLRDVKDKPVHLLGGGTTVSTKAMLIAELLGYRTLLLFGMDSCYMSGEHHAMSQPQNDDERVVDAVYGDRVFKCAPWMIGQAQDFIEFAQRFEGDIAVAGDGLLAHIARVGVPESAPDQRAREILSRLNPEGPVVGAEIGVFAGCLSSRLLSRKDLILYMVDSWGDYDQSFLDDQNYHSTLTAEVQEQYFQKTLHMVDFARDRAWVMRTKSVKAAEQLRQHLLDFVFIDADHTYQAVKDDIKAWAPKLRKGGILSGHDYDNTAFPHWGVKAAVDEFVAQNGLNLELGDNYTWFVKIDKDIHAD